MRMPRTPATRVTSPPILSASVCCPQRNNDAADSLSFPLSDRPPDPRNHVDPEDGVPGSGAPGFCVGGHHSGRKGVPGREQGQGGRCRNFLRPPVQGAQDREGGREDPPQEHQVPVPLQGHNNHWRGVRQLLQARKALRFRPQPGHQGLDGGHADDEGGRPLGTLHPFRTGVRGQQALRAHHSRSGAHLRTRTHRGARARRCQNRRVVITALRGHARARRYRVSRHGDDWLN